MLDQEQTIRIKVEEKGHFTPDQKAWGLKSYERGYGEGEGGGLSKGIYDARSPVPSLQAP